MSWQEGMGYRAQVSILDLERSRDSLSMVIGEQTDRDAGRSMDVKAGE